MIKMEASLLSPRSELLLKANKQHLCDKIHLDSSNLLADSLAEAVFTEPQVQSIRVG